MLTIEVSLPELSSNVTTIAQILVRTTEREIAKSHAPAHFPKCKHQLSKHPSHPAVPIMEDLLHRNLSHFLKKKRASAT